jgi:rod shape determining protein RodA
MTKIRAMRATSPDRWLVLAVLALLAIGMLAIYSATHATAGSTKVLKQGTWALLGFLAAGGLALTDYRTWTRSAWGLYGITVAALVATLFTHPINGAHSWFSLGHGISLQTSEFAKVALILTFGAFMHRLGPRLNQPVDFLKLFGLFLIPLGLILKQPDMGTASVCFGIWLVMAWAAETRGWLLGALVLGAVLLFGVAWQTNLIKPYQKERLDFIHADPTGNGYHQRQAYIALGSGGVWGKGYLHNTQAKRGFLPEQDTDFIFAVIGEEFGLVGTLAVLALFCVILLRLIRLADEADTPFGRYIVAGVAALLAAHVIINIGMCLSLLPVTGVPLPFVSYGGSNLLTCLLGVGLVLNVSRYRQTRRAWAGPEEPLLRAEEITGS